MSNRKIAFEFGDVVVLRDGFKGKITGRSFGSEMHYDVTDSNNKRINGIPAHAIDVDRENTANT